MRNPQSNTADIQRTVNKPLPAASIAGAVQVQVQVQVVAP